MTEFATILAGSSEANLFAAAVVGTVAGFYLFYRGFRLLQRRRLILNTPESKIRSASMGLVEINGLATGPNVITSPLKQVDCFYYRSVAWELRQQGKNSEWIKIGEECLHVPFYLDDGTGTVLINPSGADMDLHCDFKEEYGNSLFVTSGAMSGNVSQFLARHGANFDRRLKVEEFCIKPKNFLFVLGTLAQNPLSSSLDSSAAPVAPTIATATAAVGPDHSRPLADVNGVPLVGANYRQVIHLTAEPNSVPATEMTQQQRVAAALVKAGVTNPAAWLTAGVSQQDAAVAKSSEINMTTNLSGNSHAGPAVEAPFDPHPPIALMKGTHDPAFFISWRSQREVLSSLGWKSALMIWGGPALTLVCVYILLAHFNLL
ncbi:MAG TPA: hypothetical protein VLW06_06010 [Terriglobales bacterium]|nr:hypothetical protein [Terriglobales bacterium]